MCLGKLQDMANKTPFGNVEHFHGICGEQSLETIQGIRGNEWLQGELSTFQGKWGDMSLESRGIWEGIKGNSLSR